MKKSRPEPPLHDVLKDRAAERMNKHLHRPGHGNDAAPQKEEPLALLQELQIHKIELEMQNEELRRVHGELEALLDQYTSLYDFAPLGYFTLDRGGAIRRVNLAGAALLGEERGRLLDRRFGLFVSAADRAAFGGFLENLFSDPAAAEGPVGCEVALEAKRDQPPGPDFSYGRRRVRIEARTAEGGRECRAVAIDITDMKRQENRLLETLESLRRAVNTTIQVMVSAVEVRDPHTAGHQTRAADLACAIAAEMRLPQGTIDGVRMAGSIHDIGKLSIPAEILSKPGKLHEIEFLLIKEHARKGYEMLKNVESSWPLAEMVYQHHERMDGSGYPRNLRGEAILLEARILAVADVVEAMASHRPYRPSLGIDEALGEIEKGSGVRFDAAVAAACLRLFREKGFRLATIS